MLSIHKPKKRFLSKMTLKEFLTSGAARDFSAGCQFFNQTFPRSLTKKIQARTLISVMLSIHIILSNWRLQFF